MSRSLRSAASAENSRCQLGNYSADEMISLRGERTAEVRDRLGFEMTHDWVACLSAYQGKQPYQGSFHGMPGDGIDMNNGSGVSLPEGCQVQPDFDSFFLGLKCDID